MTDNRLSHETSPYLLQHKDNPVHWRAWRPETLDEARRLNRPILLSIGYAACHWCHVMAHESFEDPDTAAVMNELFVNIKVDREERPDIDQIYMSALHALGEQGGWPLTMFLTPDGAPIWGGTYFPPTARYGRPGFTDVLREIARLFAEEPDRIGAARDQLLAALNSAPDRQAIRLDQALLDAASGKLLGILDHDHGGARGAPKFPQASLLELLWRAAPRTGHPDYADAVRLTLTHICQGGIYDHLGGGFARYSVDERWLVPHFEKMLYDNGQLIELLAYAWTAGKEELFRLRIEETVGWLLREMATEEGAFAASLDADSDGGEGRFYVWTETEILGCLGPDDGAFFAAHYDVTPGGNWEEVSILNRLHDLRLGDSETEARLAALRGKLFERRAPRPRPARDDKILADWNGLAIAGLAIAAVQLHRPDWLARAAAAYRFIAESMAESRRLAHAYRDGQSVRPGFAADHGAMIKAALSLFQATGTVDYLADAEAWADTLLTHYADPAGGFFMTADDAEGLVARLKPTFDEALPSANALALMALVQLWLLTGRDRYRAAADASLQALSGEITGNIFGAAGLLNALDQRLNGIQVVIVAPDNDDAQPLLDVARRYLRPAMTIARYVDTGGLDPAHPAHGKTAVDGQPTAYVCRGETCSLPVTTAEDLATLLS